MSHYSDLSSFRAVTPSSAKNPSPMSRLKPQSDLFFSLKTSRSPSPVLLSPRVRSSRLNVEGSTRKLQDVLKIEDIRKALEVLAGMSDKELKQLPFSYSQELTKFCSQTLNKVRGFDF